MSRNPVAREAVGGTQISDQPTATGAEQQPVPSATAIPHEPPPDQGTAAPYPQAPQPDQGTIPQPTSEQPSTTRAAPGADVGDEDGE